MTAGNKFTVAVFAAALAALMVPVFVQAGMPSRPEAGMSMGHMGQGMMDGGTMSGDTMAGCAGMMQSMNHGGNGRPNSQWRKPPSPDPDNGG
jgi:hypothetical protein